MSKSFDVVVIGAGPGGYVAAIRAAQLGFATACIDSNKNAAGKPALGGTCLNVGCIPSKALLESSEQFHKMTHEAEVHGISVKGASIDVPKMIARKQKIVDQFTGGIQMLFKKNKVTSLHGHGKILRRENEKWLVQVAGDAGSEEIEAKHVIIASGSKPRYIPGIAVDNVDILDNVGALDISETPKRLGVIGAGVIGLEMGSVWRRLGSEVTILEAMPAFLAAADEEVAKTAQKIFTKELGLNIQTGVKIGEVTKGKKTISINYEDAAGVKQTLEVDKLIVAVGRVPNTDDIAAPEVGLRFDNRGFVEVDGHCHAGIPNVWAVGDVVRGPMLAHKASEEGVAVAERIAGQAGHVDFNTVPWVIYTAPEIAWVGKTESQLKADGIDYKKGSFPFAINGRAHSLNATQGFVKVLADAKTDRLLGVHIVGPVAGELISEAVVAMEFRASSEDLARIIHAHPSLAEVIHEAALAVDKRAIHN